MNKVERLEQIFNPMEEKGELTKEEYLKGEAGRIYKEVYPVKFESKKGAGHKVREGEIFDHLGQTKMAYFPYDFKPEPSTLYDVEITYDSQMGKSDGYWILRVLGEYEKEDDKLEKYLKGEWNCLYEVLPEKITNPETGKERYYTFVITDHLGINKRGWFPENWQPTDSESLYKVKIISDSQPGEEGGRWLLEVAGKSVKKEFQKEQRSTQTQTLREMMREKKRN